MNNTPIQTKRGRGCPKAPKKIIEKVSKEIEGRGVFCGVCLKNRYGMDIKEALKDANYKDVIAPFVEIGLEKELSHLVGPRKRIPI